MAAKTNRTISDNAPSNYLVRIQRYTDIDDNKLEKILASHLIKSVTLHSDNFDDFFKARESALLDRIEKAIGKSISREVYVPDDNIAEPFEDEDIMDEQMG